MVDSLRFSVSEHAEEVSVLRLQLEEERTRTIMLDEERSRLSHDNSAVRNRLNEAKVRTPRTFAVIPPRFFVKYHIHLTVISL